MYLTLYPQAPDTASQVNVAAVKVIPVVVAFNGLVQGVNVVKLSVADHADTELLSVEHAERTCHSYVVEEDKPVLVCEVFGKLSIKSVHVAEPCALNLRS